MSCSDCFTNCTDIHPDKCIKYTGEDVDELGIVNNTSLLVVEQQIIEHLLSALNGTGVTFDMGTVCDVIQQYLPTPQQISLKDIIGALIQAVCEMNTRLEATEDVIENLTQAYSTGCLGTVPSDIHSILQATITKVCATADDITAFKKSVKANYVKIADLDTLIQQYLDTH